METANVGLKAIELGATQPWAMAISRKFIAWPAVVSQTTAKASSGRPASKSSQVRAKRPGAGRALTACRHGSSSPFPRQSAVAAARPAAAWTSAAAAWGGVAPRRRGCSSALR